eukprot:CAMPEP_0170457668 /NCGR_PEP_ID=MMETSP0123-20130129/4882_1 /TAXON_ID=182087 /ORGANISM="Favella ehrenbergii, Strain Fehren 1" /LENGTH=131 /DNA_ID=CAMNT_0010721535 /DNA_START=1570 /DNA_END=1965 /DNA_ORIENTATION=-
MDDSLLVYLLNTADHLSGDVEAGLEVKLAAALLEEIFETLAEQVHDHDMVGLAVVGLLISNEVEEGHVCLATQLVNQLTLPEKHNVALSFYRFFHFGGQVFSSLPFLDFVDFTESTATELLDDSVALLQND